VGIPRTRGFLYSPWQPLEISCPIAPLGQLYQSPPSPIPGDQARGKRRPRSRCAPLAVRQSLYGQSKKIRFFFFLVALNISPKLTFLPNNLFCHLPDSSDWPVPTATARAVFTGQCGEFGDDKISCFVGVGQNLGEMLRATKKTQKNNYFLRLSM